MPGKNLVSFEKAASTASYAEIQVLIGRQLNAGYDVAEPIPDRLAELLKQLARPLGRLNVARIADRHSLSSLVLGLSQNGTFGGVAGLRVG